MRVDIYRAKILPGNHEKLYIFVPTGTDVENLPADVLERTGGLVLEKKIDIQPGEKRIALDTDEAIKNLEEKGYHEQGSKIVFEIRVGGNKV
jgi:uncharacterized protein YcgL (UPF0745 family)